MTETDDQVSEPRAEKPKFLTQTRFDALNIPEPILKGLAEANFILCTPIQAQTLPLSLSGKDVGGQAQTGTGKTAAYLVTVFATLFRDAKRNQGEPGAIIVSPTRELSQQIYEEAVLIGKYTGLTTAQIIGGIDYQKQADILRGGVDIVICTPGRIIDYFKQGIFKTNNIKIAVIDEADRLLDMGFAKDMRFILQKMPKYDKRQTLLFSATLSFKVMELTYEFMNLPEFISVTPEEVTVDGIEQSLFHVSSDQKLSLLLGLLEKETWERILIFVNTKSGVEWLSSKLRGNGWPAEGITGDIPQAKRFKLMARFKDGTIKILVATDVASRGIHVDDISHVINFDLPQDPENYVHRIGRTARAGKTGKALTLACENYVFHLEPLESLINYKIPVVWPEEDWFREDKAKDVQSARYSKDKARRPERKKPSSATPRRSDRTERNKETPAFKFIIKRGENYFPGTFFGFRPESADLSEDSSPDFKMTEDIEYLEDVPEKISGRDNTETSPMEIIPGTITESPAETAQALTDENTETAPVIKKKRRRRRYNKKKNPASGSE